MAYWPDDADSCGDDLAEDPAAVDCRRVARSCPRADSGCCSDGPDARDASCAVAVYCWASSCRAALGGRRVGCLAAAAAVAVAVVALPNGVEACRAAMAVAGGEAAADSSSGCCSCGGLCVINNIDYFPKVLDIFLDYSISCELC